MTFRRPVLRIGIGIVGALFLLALAFVAFAYWEAAFRDPTVRRAEVALADWPRGAKPVTVLLVSDTHVAGPDMPPDRLVRLVEGLNMLKPDMVLLAGDYISHKRGATHHYRIADAVAPLTYFRAPLGVIAVLGNHDHWAGSAAFSQAIRETGITLLSNEAIRRGPLVIAGLDDRFSGHADFAQTGRAMQAFGPGPRLLLTHAPDVARILPFTVDAVLAGHTHCGQIDLPFIGMPANDGHAFAWLPCGRLMIGSTPLFVGAGLGTSVIPFRFGAPPDVWLIRFGPKT
ncbi:MAG: metallophosphoesterase [Sphingobium sp.]|nr:metallophosphoesterase [Sphingobium sp.]